MIDWRTIITTILILSLGMHCNGASLFLTNTPTNARKNFYSIIKDANDQKRPVMIGAADGNEKKSAVIISK